MPTEAAKDEEETYERRGKGEEEVFEKWVFQFQIDIKELVDQKREKLQEEKRNMSKIEESDPQEKGPSDSTYTLIPDLSSQL